MTKRRYSTDHLPTLFCLNSFWITPGAGSMQGKDVGLKTQVLQLENRALTVWCYAHNTNLVASESLKKCKSMKDAISTAELIIKSIKWSPKREATLNRMKQEFSLKSS